MLQELLASFTQSPQGQQAMQRLQQQGVPQDQASSILGAAFPAAAQSLHGQLLGGAGGGGGGGGGAGGILSNFFGGGSGGSGGGQGPIGITEIGKSSYVTNFLSAAVSGLVRGQGLKNAAIDGAQGVVGGHVAQVIASRFGLPTGVAGAIGAVVTPLIIDFLWQKMQGGGLNLGSMFGGGAGATPADPNASSFGAGQGSPSQTSPTGAPQGGGGVVDSVKSGFGSLFQSDPGGFTPSSFNPYG